MSLPPGRPKEGSLPLGGKARSAKGAPLSPLARDLTLILIAKAIVLGLLWFAFFRSPAAPHMAMDPQRVEQSVLAPTVLTPAPSPEIPNAVR